MVRRHGRPLFLALAPARLWEIAPTSGPRPEVCPHRRTSWRTSRPKLVRQRKPREAEYRDVVGVYSGGAEGDRTPDLLIAKEAVPRAAMGPELSNNIIQKGLAFDRDWSGTVASSGAPWALRDPAPPASWPRWGFGGAARRRHEPNGGSQCQRLRSNDQLHHPQRLFRPQILCDRPLTISRQKNLSRARSNLASSPCCNRPRGQRLPR